MILVLKIGFKLLEYFESFLLDFWKLEKEEKRWASFYFLFCYEYLFKFNICKKMKKKLTQFNPKF